MKLPIIAALVIAIIFLIGVASTLLARRIDRLNRTVVKSRFALEHALTARARYAREFADTQVLDLASAILLIDAAEACQRSSMFPIIDDGLDQLDQFSHHGGEADRRSLESDLSRTLRLTVDELSDDEIPDRARDCFDKLTRARLDVRMTRSFHNSHVARIQQVRRGWFISMFRIAGRAPIPMTVDIDDE
ncbi:hypothetical protein I6E29_04780 [Arcanobacterium haemolyticum]|nr:hypothetical protein [Arcanobacterium haemolyticum]